MSDLISKEELLNLADYEVACELPEQHRLTEYAAGQVSLKEGVKEADAQEVARKYGDFLLFCDEVDEISDLLTAPKRPFAANHVLVSPHVGGILSPLGIVDRPITMTVKHVWAAMQPGPWEGGDFHHHGIPVATLKRLPWLLEHPALVANSKDDATKLILALPATDNRGMPLISPIKIDAQGRLDVDEFIANLVCTVFGPVDFYDYFGLALKPSNIVFIDSEMEAELCELTGRAVFSNLADLSRDTELAHPQILGEPDFVVEGHDTTWLVERVREHFSVVVQPEEDREV
ncbi:hypothetical protein [Paratractidigestivibacter sp.]|uniref:MuF-C-terminal domain-containing protein n=1 Tax=Paratractidigestivibacter sp. TaxID=2847316 RepID=UPI002AC90D59|nr:hypothetical protein [Paratractidigestivibacter sp.]